MQLATDKGQSAAERLKGVLVKDLLAEGVAAVVTVRWPVFTVIVAESTTAAEHQRAGAVCEKFSTRYQMYVMLPAL